ncbi:MAG: hypothetical protein ABI383_08255, partial [Acidobacteriaceae bacterium]
MPNHNHSLSTDLERLEHAHQAPRCIHIKTNGTRCKSPALKKDLYCFFHQQIHARPEFEPRNFDLGSLEDANSIQLTIQQVLRAVLRGEIDPKTARLALYGLQIAARNLKNCNFEPKMAEEVVLDDLQCDDPECDCNDPSSPECTVGINQWVSTGVNFDPLRALH